MDKLSGEGGGGLGVAVWRRAAGLWGLADLDDRGRETALDYFKRIYSTLCN
jgi:hypothetical protein